MITGVISHANCSTWLRHAEHLRALCAACLRSPVLYMFTAAMTCTAGDRAALRTGSGVPRWRRPLRTRLHSAQFHASSDALFEESTPRSAPQAAPAAPLTGLETDLLYGCSTPCCVGPQRV